MAWQTDLGVAFLHLLEQNEEPLEGRPEVGLQLLGGELEVVDYHTESLGRRQPNHQILLRSQQRQQNLEKTINSFGSIQTT